MSDFIRIQPPKQFERCIGAFEIQMLAGCPEAAVTDVALTQLRHRD
jgi:hypothetical protein